MSAKSRIIYYIQLHGRVSGSELESQATDWETKASVISRRCRELAQEGRIIRYLSDKRTVQYGLPESREQLVSVPKRFVQI